ncbi:CLUMA_CG005806, isoform A [Clunio marinus]|uniref:CLUMA_CG005806, isoform A n=1 Tax=Clunio marinus TaxID=568069 RepID=A0A1J1HVZ4_9DIPT|nr:CLUMA_CG005806, isoform A [Clunio marinus]
MFFRPVQNHFEDDKQELDKQQFNEAEKEIQKFIIEHLELTPRRKMFQDYEKKLSEMWSEIQVGGESSIITADKIKVESELKVIMELNKFRKMNAADCMSFQNQLRIKRAKEMEKDLLKSQQKFILNETMLLENLRTENPSRSVGTKKATKMKDDKVSSSDYFKSSQNEIQLRNIRFTPENTLALTHQKFKY